MEKYKEEILNLSRIKARLFSWIRIVILLTLFMDRIRIGYKKRQPYMDLGAS